MPEPTSTTRFTPTSSRTEPAARPPPDGEGRLIVVSNRVAVPTSGSTQAGGLAVAVRSLLQKRTGVWFGWSGKTSNDAKLATTTIVRDNLTYVLTDLSENDYQEYYNGFANRVLWPILHYRLDLAEFLRRDLDRLSAGQRAFRQPAS